MRGFLFFGLLLLWEFWLIHSCCASVWVTAPEGMGPRQIRRDIGMARRKRRAMLDRVDLFSSQAMV